MRTTSRGFTFVELIVVMVVMAILAAVAMPRFFGRGDVEGPGFAMELASAVRYAQKLAVVSGCPVRLAIPDATRYELQQPATAPAGTTCATDFAAGVVHPATGGAFTGAAPAGVSIGGTVPLTIEFRASGAPFTTAGAAINADVSIPVGGRTIVIAARSGYVDVQ